MRLDTTLNTRLEQKMILAPRMIQSMEILQLPIMALQERIQQELQENPVLETRETTTEEPPVADPEEIEIAQEMAKEEANDPGSAELIIDDSGGNELDFDRLEALSKDWEDHFNEEHRPSRNGMEEHGDKKHDAMQNMASRPQSLQDYLNDQLSFLDGSPEQIRLMRYVISHINEKGYLEVPLEDLANNIEGGPVPVAQVEEALKVIQKMDPPGVGARDPAECLLLQLTPETPHREILRVLILHHLEDIRHNRLPAIQRKSGFDLNAIKEAIEVLKHLNLHPGAQFTVDHIPYVVPDILVERTDEGNYEVRLLDDWLPNIYISRRYVDLYREKGSDPKTKEYLKRKIQAAQWLQESIEQRRNTLE
jgi:RNA polymerase sigma-54 factor